MHTSRWMGLGLALAAVALAGPQTKPAGQRWKFEEVQRLHERHPDDPYVSYVYLEVARREKRLRDVANDWRWRNRMNRDRGSTFSTFTGALAIQESLQLEVQLEGQIPEDEMNLRPEGAIPIGPARPPPVEPPPAEPVKPVEEPKEPAPNVRPAPAVIMSPPVTLKKPDPKKKVPLASLQGPTIQSHPWEKMLAGRKPEVGTLSLCVPEDFWFLEFRSAAALMEVLSATNQWSDHLFSQVFGQATSQDMEQRIKRRLGIQGIPPAMVDQLGLKGIALTGSDLFIAHGSDITLLLQGSQLVALRRWVDDMVGGQKDVKKATGEFLGVSWTLTTSSDGTLHVYTADPRPDLHVRSTSLPAFQRVLEAILNRSATGGPVRRLGAALEFAYIRTLLPINATQEDGLLYLSDPFIRRQIGPEVKLKQHRRLQAFNHLTMIERAALMFRTETGRAPKSLEELAKAGCAPGVFGTGALACPWGGKYELTADGMSATSTDLGAAGALRPLIELPLAEVTEAEASAYAQFVRQYSEYWRTYFDPIVVRIKSTPTQLRLETIILPLIDNSIYQDLVQFVGGRPAVPLEGKVPPTAIHSLALRVNKERMLSEAGLLEAEAADAKTRQSEPEVVAALRQLVIAMHNYHNDYDRMPPRAIVGQDKKPLLSWRVAMLPYLGEKALYDEFKLDEPWDSPHNQKLLAKMPALYAAGSAELAAKGQTRFQVPVGKGTVFPPDMQPVLLGKISAANGTSVTPAVLAVASSQAVPWTKPDDWKLDPEKPLAGLFDPGQNTLLLVTCDGATYRLNAEVDAKAWQGLLEYQSGAAAHALLNPVGPGGPRFMDLPVDPKLLRKFLMEGIGDQLAIHVLDANPPIATELLGFMDGGDLGFIGRGMPFGMGFYVQVFSHPTFLVIPVKNAQAVDDFLSEVDRRCADLLPARLERMVRIEQYKVRHGERAVRVLSLRALGLSIRLAWARVGDQLVLTNQPELLLGNTFDPGQWQPQPGGVSGHAMLRIRADRWRLSLPRAQLSWAENQRLACARSQHQLAMVARGYPELLTPDGKLTEELVRRTAQIYGGRPYCPDGGTYDMVGKETERRCRCQLHGDAVSGFICLEAPAEGSATAQTLRDFSGLSATLTFLEDGLHAVLIVERRPVKASK